MTDDAALGLCRKAGRRIIDLTGNGPPLRSERWKQALRLMPRHPVYSTIGLIFLSDARKTGRLMASIVSKADAARPNELKDLVRIQTITGVSPDSAGVDNDFEIYIDAYLFGVTTETGWSSLSSNEIARKLAQIGRMLYYGERTDFYQLDTFPHFILTNNPQTIPVLMTILTGMLAINGRDRDKESIAFQCSTPVSPQTLVFEGFEATMTPTLAKTVRVLSSPELKISYSGKAIRISDNSYRVSVANINIVDRLKYCRALRLLFEQNGWPEEDLLFLEEAREAA